MQSVEEILAYQFNHPSLLFEAMTHPSYLSSASSPSLSSSYQRLEFLGDALLGFLMTEFLYDWTPSLSSGDISHWKSFYVSNEFLSVVAVRFDIMSHIRHYSTQLQHGLEEYVRPLNQRLTTTSKEEERDNSLGVPPASAGVTQVFYSQATPPKVLADLMEALLGAIFLDSGSRLDECRKIVSMLILEPFVIPSLVEEIDSRDGEDPPDWGTQKHPVSVVHEIVSMFGCHDVVTSFSYPSADPPLACCQVSCHGKVLSEGRGRNKKSARLTAAFQLPPKQLISHLQSLCTCAMR